MSDNALTKDPGLLAKIASLKIRAIQLVEGLLSGQHRSPHKGSSVEFAEYKEYSPGDDLRHIDWKVVAKTDKYQVKQFEQSTNLKCFILFDQSGSMAYKSPHDLEKGMLKEDYAQLLAASLSFILLKQFDAVGLATFNEKIVSFLPARSKPSHFQHLVHALSEIQFEKDTLFENIVEDIIERLPRRGLLILISDLLSNEDDFIKTLKLLSSRGLDIMIFHVLHPDELDLPFQGELLFESLESDPALSANPTDIRKAYQDIIQEKLKTLSTLCPSLGVDYQFLKTSDPLDKGLRYYLLRRANYSKS